MYHAARSSALPIQCPPVILRMSSATGSEVASRFAYRDAVSTLGLGSAVESCRLMMMMNYDTHLISPSEKYRHDIKYIIFSYRANTASTCMSLETTQMGARLPGLTSTLRSKTTEHQTATFATSATSATLSLLVPISLR